MQYFCCDRQRRSAVLESAHLNGIDYLEVVDSSAANPADRQRVLLVYLLKPLESVTLTQGNIQIAGGDRIRQIQVTQVTTFPDSKVVRVRVNQWGDFSTYTLHLIAANTDSLAGFDPLLRSVDFSFKVECPSEFDCEESQPCLPEGAAQPDINYLAKDYASFRQLMLDRMALLMPQWQERNAADLGITLVELLAYVGDYLSYQQDAIATEAYLDTARRRVSVRRHARLVDYIMHEGCNARVWIQIQITIDQVTLARQANDIRTRFLTRVQDDAWLDNDRLPQIVAGDRPEVFEPLHDITLYSAHNEMNFYTWGDTRCCLPQGATQATLQGHFSHLQRGDVLIFAEVRGAKTGRPADADPSHRWAVRLTNVSLGGDPLYLQPAAEGEESQPLPITEIAWSSEDALPFPLCISERGTFERQNDSLAVSVAWGNIVLADHGLTIAQEPLGTVPAPTLFKLPLAGGDRCSPSPNIPVLPRFRPKLRSAPLTYAAAYTASLSASAQMQWAVQEAVPAIDLRSSLESQQLTWRSQPDLLKSDRSAAVFVAEVEDAVSLRFGDDQQGRRPESGTTFSATYRVGNGKAGNVGAETLVHLASSNPAITPEVIKRVSNPLAAQGGRDPESLEDVRQRAPSAFRTQERAVTATDYATVAGRFPTVQRAAATFRWTGSWRTVFLTIDRQGGAEVTPEFEAQLRQYLERYRLAGHDLEIEAPVYVSLEVEMGVCVQPGYFRSQVKAALLDLFSSRILPDRRRGIFHPDHFTFGQSVYLSRLYAAAQSVAGVASVSITTFQRQGSASNTALQSGRLDLGRLEIARLENNPNFPDRGLFRLKMAGGK
ncbi:MAG TPA: putative baseplate assembly protein [Coleofasciculaceae cyanobacterium]|jgi:hypothetical protein